MSDTAARPATRPGLCSSIELPEGRSLDVWQAGPPGGDPLVFHHGTPGAGLPFDHHVRGMGERGLRSVAWSRPGYGSSTRRPARSVADDAEDAVAVLDHLGIDRTWAVGWSGGGPHALGLAAQDPERVRGVALIGSVAHLLFTRPWGFKLGSIRSPVHIWQGAHDRMVPYAHGEWLAEHIPTACPHLSDEQGHLTLLVDTFPRILDELLAAGG